MLVDLILGDQPSLEGVEAPLAPSLIFFAPQTSNNAYPLLIISPPPRSSQLPQFSIIIFAKVFFMNLVNNNTLIHLVTDIPKIIQTAIEWKFAPLQVQMVEYEYRLVIVEQ